MLYSCGSNEEGQLGFDTKFGASSDCIDLHAVFPPEFGKTIGVACGWSHSFALLQLQMGERRLFVFGSNAFSQISLRGVAQTNIPRPLSLPLQVNVSEVFCGLRHSAFTTTDGAVWLFGENRFAQCGDSSLQAVTTPTRLPIPHFIESVALGSRHTVLLTSAGNVLCFGEDRFGQCGVDPSLIDPITRSIGLNTKPKVINDLILQPTEVPVHEAKIKFVRAGWNFSLVWTPEHQVLYLFGRNNYGQLGLGNASPFEWKPTRLDLSALLDSEIQQIECGSEHTLILTQSGSVWSFGWNEHGQLGLGDEKDRWIPTRVSGLGEEKVTRIAAGYGFSFALA